MTTDEDAALRLWLRRARWVAAAAVALSALAYLVVATRGTLDLFVERPSALFASRFFTAQAEAMRHGGLAVAPRDLPKECFNYDGGCYGYFGITPSVLRLPIIELSSLVGHTVHNGLTTVSVLVAALVATVVSTGLFLDSWAAAARARPSLVLARPRGSLVLVACVSMCLGAGSILVFLSRPGVYDEAILWSVTFTMVALWALWRWCQGNRPGFVFASAVAMVLAANARPSGATAAVAMGAFVLARVLWRSRAGVQRVGGAVLVAAALLAVLPGATAASVFVAKFDTPVPDVTLNVNIPEEQYWRGVWNTNGGKFSDPSFVVTTLAAYARPLGVRVVSHYPFLEDTDYRVFPPATSGGVFEDHTGSIPTNMPVLAVLTAGGVLAGIASTAWARRRSFLPRLAVLSGGDPGPLSRLGLVLAASGAVVPTITNVVVTHRYLGDFYPALAMGAVVAAPLLARTLLLRTGAWRAVVSVLVVLTVWSVAVNVAFTRMQGLV